MIRAITPKRLSFVVLVLLFVAAGGKAWAETYNVNAVVPYEAPTHAAVVTTPSDNKGTIVYDAQQTISGTCQLQNPHAVVSVWRAQTVLGSVECTDGTFSVPVILRLGENNLVVRTANANGIYGPDSTKIMIQFKNPVVVAPLPPNVTQPTTTQDHQEAINQGGTTGLSLTTESPFDVLPSSKQVSIRIVVGGGQTPYVLQLKWGDGSTESHSITEAGSYDFSHTYTMHKTYSVFVSARDVLGAYTEYVYAVVSGKPSTDAGESEGTTTKDEEHSGHAGPWRIVGVVWYCWIFIIFVVAFLASSYIFGYRRGKEKAEVEAQRLRASKKKRKPKKK